MLNCHEAACLFSEAQERNLRLREHLKLQAHTLFCSDCRDFGEQMKLFGHITRSCAKGTPQPHSQRLARSARRGP